mgnify:FL=1
MNNEEKENLTYDFNFDDQVVKKQEVPETKESIEVLDDSETEILDENLVTENDSENVLNDESIKENTSDVELDELTEITNNSDQTENKENVKKIKILGKEFNYEDLILIVIGLVIIAAIFLMPRIMNMFK